ncbi:MAG: hypothetical protein IT371_29795 [Deltaproteobacteria bacterium]|nr:hypothetical protein [Deltaproteobacteria bacterium]
MRSAATLCLLLPVVLATGCASTHFRTNFRSTGEFDLARDQAITDRFRQAARDPSPGPAHVRVLVDSLPVGLTYKDHVLGVASGYGHQILGKFDLAQASGAFPDYRTRWRKYLCYPQMPLAWVTLGMWVVFVPAFYPCFAGGAVQKTEIVDAVKKLVGASGGDVAIITFTGERSLAEAMGAKGFVVRIDPRFKGQPLPTKPNPPAGRPAGGLEI